MSRLQDGSRKVLNIAEVAGVNEDRIETRDLFVFERTGVTDAGRVQGRYRGTGYAPKVLERLRVSGINLPPALFEETQNVNL